MENGIFSIFNEAVNAGIITDTALLLIIIGLIGGLYKYMFRPMSDKLMSIPSSSDIEDIVNTGNADLHISNIANKLEELVNKLDQISEISKGNERDIEDIKRDIEHVKQILNQFQGHMMYGGGRRAGDFGNQELR